jgi:hypothetical protein
MVLALYIILFAAAVLLPLRWGLVAFLILSNIDMGAGIEAHLGALNTLKAIVLPAYFLWRLRRYTGHQKVVIAPVAWILFTIYVGIAGFWSYFPMSALKLVGHMGGSLLICIVFILATKGGYLTPSVVFPVTAGVLVLALLRGTFLPTYGDETTRFTAFSSAQGFAAFLAAMYCLALCTKSTVRGLRGVTVAALAVALIFNGSRTWTIGCCLATLIALMISKAQPWVKICVSGAAIIAAALLVAAREPVMGVLAHTAESNRIAAAVYAVYEGDVASLGLGTYNFRRELDRRTIETVKESSIPELIFGHGSCNGPIGVPTRVTKNPNPNMFFHNEWLRVIYEWGLLGVALWLTFFGSIAAFAIQGVRRDANGGYAKPLVVYLPALLVGLGGENMIAGAGNGVTAGFLLLIALASIAHRQARGYLSPRVTAPARLEDVPVMWNRRTRDRESGSAARLPGVP